ncbi:hypothetical protein BKA63DRAFT_489652 [Paraphoma chrysanthemicola]|nr:hypothetical protein BKA63DRAFT_489652 [Paraphoma chrysanthemicola]
MFRKLKHAFKNSDQPHSKPVLVSQSSHPPATREQRTVKLLGKKSHPTTTQVELSEIDDDYAQPEQIGPGDRPGTYLVQAHDIRHLRKQLQLRYALDTHIWNEGYTAKTWEQPPLEEQMCKSDALLESIMNMVNGWNNAAFFSDSDYMIFCEIKKRLDEGGQGIGIDRFYDVQTAGNGSLLSKDGVLSSEAVPMHCVK